MRKNRTFAFLLAANVYGLLALAVEPPAPKPLLLGHGALPPRLKLSEPRLCDEPVEKVVEYLKAECAGASAFSPRSLEPVVSKPFFEAPRAAKDTSLFDKKKPAEIEIDFSALRGLFSVGLQCSEISAFQRSLRTLLTKGSSAKVLVKGKKAPDAWEFLSDQYLALKTLASEKDLRTRLQADMGAAACEDSRMPILNDLALAQRASKIFESLKGKKVRSLEELRKMVDPKDSAFIDLLYGNQSSGNLLDLWLDPARANYLRDMVVNGPFKPGNLSVSQKLEAGSLLSSKLVGKNVDKDLPRLLQEAAVLNPYKALAAATAVKEKVAKGVHPDTRRYFQEILDRIDKVGVISADVRSKFEAARLRTLLHDLIAAMDTKVTAEGKALVKAILPPETAALTRENDPYSSRAALGKTFDVPADLVEAPLILSELEAAAKEVPGELGFLRAKAGLTKDAVVELTQRLEAARSQFSESIAPLARNISPHFYGRELAGERSILAPRSSDETSIDKVARSVDELGLGMTSEDRLRLEKELSPLSKRLLANMSVVASARSLEEDDSSDTKKTYQADLIDLSKIAFSPAGQDKKVQEETLNSWMNDGESADSLVNTLMSSLPENLRESGTLTPEKKAQLAANIEKALREHSGNGSDAEAAMVLLSTVLRETGHGPGTTKPVYTPSADGSYKEELHAEVLRRRIGILNHDREELAQDEKLKKDVVGKVDSLRERLAANGFGLPVHSELGLIRFLRDGGAAAREGLDLLESSLKPKEFAKVLAALDPENVAELIAGALLSHSPQAHYLVTDPHAMEQRTFAEIIRETTKSAVLTPQALQKASGLTSVFSSCFRKTTYPTEEKQNDCIREMLLQESAVHLLEKGKEQDARTLLEDHYTGNDLEQILKLYTATADARRTNRALEGPGLPTAEELAQSFEAASDQTSAIEHKRRALFGQWNQKQRDLERSMAEREDLVRREERFLDSNILAAEDALTSAKQAIETIYWKLNPADRSRLAELQYQRRNLLKDKGPRKELDAVDSELAKLRRKAGFFGEKLSVDDLKKIHDAEDLVRSAKKIREEKYQENKNKALVFLSQVEGKRSPVHNPLSAEADSPVERQKSVLGLLANCKYLPFYEKQYEAALAQNASESVVQKMEASINYNRTFCTEERIALLDKIDSLTVSLSEKGELELESAAVDRSGIAALAKELHAIGYANEENLPISARIKAVLDRCENGKCDVNEGVREYLADLYKAHTKAKPGSLEDLDRQNSEITNTRLQLAREQMQEAETFSLFSRLVERSRLQEQFNSESAWEEEVKAKLAEGYKDWAPALVEEAVEAKYRNVFAPMKQSLERGKALSELIASHKEAPTAEQAKDPKALRQWLKDHRLEELANNWVWQASAGLGGSARLTEKQAWALLGSWAGKEQLKQTETEARRKEIVSELAPIVGPTGERFAGGQLWDWESAKLWKLAPSGTAEGAARGRYAMTQERFKALLDEYHSLLGGSHGLNQGQAVNGIGRDEFEDLIHDKFLAVGSGDVWGYKSAATALNKDSLVRLTNSGYEFVDFEREKPAIEARVQQMNALLANNGALAKAMAKQAEWGEGGKRILNGFTSANAETANDRHVEALFNEASSGIESIRALGMARLKIANPAKVGQTLDRDAESVADNLRAQLKLRNTQQGVNLKGVIKGYDELATDVVVTAALTGVTLGANLPFQALALTARGATAMRLARTANAAKNMYSSLNKLRRTPAMLAKLNKAGKSLTSSHWAASKSLEYGKSAINMGKMSLKSSAVGVPIQWGFGAWRVYQGDLKANDLARYPSLDQNPKNGRPDWEDALNAGVSYSFPKELQHEIDIDDNGIPDSVDLAERGVVGAILPSRYTTGSLLQLHDQAKGGLMTMMAAPLAAGAVGKFVLQPGVKLGGYGMAQANKVLPVEKARKYLGFWPVSAATTAESFKMMGGMAATKFTQKMTAGEQSLLNNVYNNLSDNRFIDHLIDTSFESSFMAPFDEFGVMAVMKRNPGISNEKIRAIKMLVNHGQDAGQGLYEVYSKGGYQTANGEKMTSYLWGALASMAEGGYMSQKASDPRSALMDALPKMIADEMKTQSRAGLDPEHAQLNRVVRPGVTMRDVILKDAKLADFKEVKNRGAAVAMMAGQLASKGVPASEISRYFDSALKKVGFLERNFGELDTFVNNVVREKAIEDVGTGAITAAEFLKIEDVFGRPGRFHHRLELAETIDPSAGKWKSPEVEALVQKVAQDFSLKPEVFEQYVLDSFRKNPARSAHVQLRTLAKQKAEEDMKRAFQARSKALRK